MLAASTRRAQRGGPRRLPGRIDGAWVESVLQAGFKSLNDVWKGLRDSRYNWAMQFAGEASLH